VIGVTLASQKWLPCQPEIHLKCRNCSTNLKRITFKTEKKKVAYFTRAKSSEMESQHNAEGVANLKELARRLTQDHNSNKKVQKVPIVMGKAL
jgi:hypothetical protein